MCLSASPIDSTIYHEVFNAEGQSGSCRGNGGSSDKVDSKSKGETDQAACEAECTALSNCVGYSHNDDTNNGICIVYGPGMDGICSVADKETELECGTCSISGTATTMERTCGSCTKEPFPGYANTESMCLNSGGTWTAGIWTPGIWSGPTNGWEGSSHHTTHVHSTDGSANHHCYDSDLYDHIATCVGNETCQTDFENERNSTDCPTGCTFTNRSGLTPPLCDGTATDAEWIPDCKAAFESTFSQSQCGSGCTFISAPEVNPSLKTSNMPPTNYDGWSSELKSWGDWDNADDCSGDQTATCWERDSGVCRASNTSRANTNYKYSKTSVASNGLTVGSQEGCKQACLDSPTGTCVAYSYSEGSWCLVYGPHEHMEYALNYTVKNSTHSWTDDAWGPVSNPQIPCVLENVPEGCKSLDTAKPNPSYTCIPLVRTIDRWKAFGLSEIIAYIEVRVITSSNDSSLFTSTVLTLLKRRMAEISFVIEDDVTLTLEISDDKVVLLFLVKTTATTEAPMVKLLQWLMSTDQVQAIFLNYLPGASTIILGTSVVIPENSGTNKRLSRVEIAVIAISVIIILVLGAFIIWKYICRKAGEDSRAKLCTFEDAGDL